MCSLTDRVSLLETMLKEQGVEAPPANHPPKTRHPPQEGDASPNHKITDAQQSQPENYSPGSQPSPQDDYEMEHNDQENGSYQGEADSTGSPSMLPPPKKDG
jgi:hypothetical protein